MIPDTVVLGGGLIGLSVALAAAARGLRVSIVSTRLPGEASAAAAGMLAPTLEHAGEANDSAARAFALASRDRYPDFLEWLVDRTGRRVPLDRTGILEVASSNVALADLRARAGSSLELLDARELAAIEPGLRAHGALLHHHDGAVDNVALLEALRAAVAESTIVAIEGEAIRLGKPSPDAVMHVELADGSRVDAATVVVATGAWAGRLGGMPRVIPVRPLRGQIIAFEERPLRRVVYGPDGYLVPRASGRLLAGATMEDVGFAPATTAEAITSLRAMAERLCPALGGSRAPSAWSGLRPATPDLLPLIGPDPDLPSLHYACGHSRNGVLMAPLTGDCIAAMLAGEESPWNLSAFMPSRFG